MQGGEHAQHNASHGIIMHRCNHCGQCYETYTTRAPVAAQRMAAANNRACKKHMTVMTGHAQQGQMSHTKQQQQQTGRRRGTHCTHLQSCSLCDMRLAPLCQLLRGMRKVAVAAAGRIHEHTVISGKERHTSHITPHVTRIKSHADSTCMAVSPFRRNLLLQQRPLSAVMPTHAHARIHRLTAGGEREIVRRLTRTISLLVAAAGAAFSTCSAP